MSQTLRNRLCQICQKNSASGPRIVGSVREGTSVKALKSLLMCDECYHDYKNGIIAIEEVRNEN